MSVQFVLQPTANPAALFPASIVQTPVSRASTSLTTLHPIEQGPRLGFDSKPNFVGTLPVPGTTLHLAPDQEIYGEGDEARSLFQVVSGVVRTCKFLDDGRRQIDAFYVAGDVFGVEPGTEYRLSAEAVSEVTLVSYRRTSLEKV
ncbi:MAG TPA: cyclic nucleotide-binding domain-containing protein, partial [Dongiaceae bacterium]